MGVTLESFLVGTLGLTVLLVASLVTAFARPVPADPGRVCFLLRVAVVIQGLHCLEEAVFGFPTLFPEFFRLAPWPLPLFLAFNGFWLVVWLAASFVPSPGRFVLAFIWFLALASLANGLVHPALALRSLGYFPGLVTAPLVFVAGLLLARELWRRA